MKRNVKGEVKSANRVITDLLGDHSVQEEKSVVGQVVKIISWEFNLLTQTVTVARKNQEAMYCVFNVDLDGMTNLKKIQP
jgi:hypothetical protein